MEGLSMQTASINPFPSMEGGSGGAEAGLTKPILVEEFLETRASERGSAAEEEEEEFGDPEALIDSGNAYAWEVGCDKTWDQLRERDGRLDLAGSLLLAAAAEEKRRQQKAKAEGPKPSTRKGTMRNLLILLDMSAATLESDMRPDRFTCMTVALEDFLQSFFQFNPLASVGLVAMLHAQAICVNSLSGNPEEQVQRLIELRSRSAPGGILSLLNGLERGIALLSQCPPYATRELLILFGSINTSDSGSIFDAIDELKDRGIRASVVSVTPELYILRKICNETGGSYHACRTREELGNAIAAFRAAPLWTASIETRLVPMGFPRMTTSTTVSLCVCHNKPSLAHYMCPRCHSKICEVPTKCKACNLHLASAADLSRTSQHLNAPPTSKEEKSGDTRTCALCALPFSAGGMICTSGCDAVFCHYCDHLRIEVLRQCPTCFRKIEIERRTAITAR